MKEIFGHALSLGGTITGEHGVGLAKKAVPQGPDRRRQPRPPQAGEADARPRKPPQPREDLRPVSAEPNLLKSLDYSVLQQCMHCGLCLPSCPTYLETGRERNSPRGRISLMRAIADGELAATRTFAEEMAYCLGCLACTTACPAGVDYGTLFEAARAEAERSGAQSGPSDRSSASRCGSCSCGPPRSGLRQAPAILSRRADFAVSSGGRGSIQSCRERSASSRGRCSQYEANSRMRSLRALKSLRARSGHRVAVLTGCIQDIAFSDVNRATVDVLLANGCEVTTRRASPAAARCMSTTEISRPPGARPAPDRRHRPRQI
jgi:glycolate oxidase iron-sulfur subunit